MNPYAKYAPWAAVALGALFLVGAWASGSAMYRTEEAFDFQRLAKLPVVERGREKPLDTVARTILMIISGKQSFVEEIKREGQSQPDEVRQPAIKFLLDLATAGPELKGPAGQHKVFRIENEELLDYLGLQPRHGFRYAVDEFRSRVFDSQPDSEQRKPLNPEFFERYETIRLKKQRDLFETKFFEFANHLFAARQIAVLETPLYVAPLRKGEEWVGLLEFVRGGNEQENPFALGHILLLRAYVADQPEEFNRTLDEFEQLFGQRLGDAYSNAQFEVFFNKLAPFYQCIVLYIFVFLLAAGSWLAWPQALNRSAFWLAVLTFSIHTWAIIARMYIQGRPPVTNLYSSAVFIGWGAVGVCLILEMIYKNGLGNAVGAVVGSLTLIVAHYLSMDGDTLEMMQAVLDTNFWLATHVTCITLGYTATFVAGTLASNYVLLGVFTRVLADKNISFTLAGVWAPVLNRSSENVGVKLTKMTYGVVCFAMFLSFTGTVLGGIWADQSWGRFWGWDPKENGALLIVIWNALILHARWAGMVKARGMALLAIFGNCVTAWSWFGTNLLGVGLHSYGFMQGAMTWLLVYVLSQLALIALGSLPLQYWRSFAPPRAPLAA
jgi:ABC-type transport system involved in cytochrome c biogenesis permease subunit